MTIDFNAEVQSGTLLQTFMMKDFNSSCGSNILKA
jgi:hypothetical protein